MPGPVFCTLSSFWVTIRRIKGSGMYTAGLNPFYASNFSLWSAYCAGGFAVDTMKKPSFCIADILQAGDAENIPGSSALMVHMGHHRAHGHSGSSPLRPSPVAPEPSVFGARVTPASPYHRHGLQLTSVSRTTFNSQQAPPPSSKDLKFGIDRILSTDFDQKSKEASSLRGEQWGFISHRQIIIIIKKEAVLGLTNRPAVSIRTINENVYIYFFFLKLLYWL